MRMIIALSLSLIAGSAYARPVNAPDANGVCTYPVTKAEYRTWKRQGPECPYQPVGIGCSPNLPWCDWYQPKHRVIR